MDCGDYDYSIRVDQNGACVCAKNRTSLLHGLMTLLDRIRLQETFGEAICKIDCCEILDRPMLSTRMVHLCIFPETELWEIQRFLRFAAALKYTHLILEFWGMLQYDCMKELAWKHAFSKDEIRPLIREARDLGLEIVPMFNHWGHASACRVMHGKHVVLDQAPQLQYLFSDNGWCWDIRSASVQRLLRSIRQELCELCGEGDYFHIGCDEAYGFDMTCKEDRDALCDYINAISEELSAMGRRAIVWGDMLLFKHPHYNPQNAYVCNCPTEEAAREMLERLDRRLLLADWQYDTPVVPVETAAVFQNAGFDTLLCPWDRSLPKLNACIETASSLQLAGILHTTWHTLSSGMHYVMIAALGAYDGTYVARASRVASKAAAHLRRVSFAEGDYERAGWSKRQIGDIT